MYSKSANCYYCEHGKIITENGIKKAVCSDQSLNKITLDAYTAIKHCSNFTPNAEQRAYDEYQRTHSVHYEEPKKR